MKKTAIERLLDKFRATTWYNADEIEQEFLDFGIPEHKKEIQAIGDEIEKQSREHITIDGMRFTGISLAEVHRILTKYGYKNNPPF